MSTKSKYGCSQTRLYAASRLALRLAMKNLRKFSELKAMYTAAFITGIFDMVDKAEKIENAKLRLEHKSSLREELEGLAKAVADNWQLLKTYIDTAWTGKLRTIKYEAAGIAYYTKASSYSWDSVASLILSGSGFIDKFLVELSANDNMPREFQGIFLESAKKYTDKAGEYADAYPEQTIGSNDKVEANNKVYDAIIAICKDGQRIFKDDKTMKSQFTFSKLKRMVGEGGSSGIKVLVKNAGDNMPMMGVTVTDIEGNLAGTTDQEGRLAILKLAAGDHVYTFSKPGATPQTITFTLKTATVSNFDVILIAAEGEMAAA